MNVLLLVCSWLLSLGEGAVIVLLLCQGSRHRRSLLMTRLSRLLTGSWSRMQIVLHRRPVTSDLSRCRDWSDMEAILRPALARDVAAWQREAAR